MKERWIKDLRKRFTDRKVSPPDGLWQDIESAMAAKGAATQKIERRHSPTAVMLRRAATAAACVAVLTGIGWLLLHKEYYTTETTEPTGHYAMTVNKDIAKQTDTNLKENENADVHWPSTFRIKKTHAAVTSKTYEKAAQPEQTTWHETRECPDNTVTTAPTKDNDYTGSVVIRQKPPHSDAHGSGRDKNMLADVPAIRRHGHDEVAVAVFGGGLATMGGSTGSGNAALLASNMLQNDAGCNNKDKEFRLTSAVFGNNEEQTEVRVRHRQPIRLGMSVRVKLSGRFGLETGISYSYLSSDIASGDESGGYDTDQKLHYVGIPLAVNYDIWNTEHVEIYASAGGAVDFCASGKTHTNYVSGNIITVSTEESLRDKRPQWSANASAGIQYNFNDIIGIYAEPGISYYFDNGSEVNTIFKEKPFNFNLNVGIRFTVR